MSTTLTQSIASAIQQQEGFGTPNAVTINANNNPGALRTWPGFPSRNGFAVFPDYATGRAALETDVQTNINAGLSLNDFLNKYAPTSENDTSSYIAFVSRQTGLDPNAPMNMVATAAPDASTIDPASVLADLGFPSDGGSLQSSSLDWGTIGLVGLGALMLWYLADEFLG